MMPQSDQLLEDIYDLINRHRDEPTRLELSRIALLAVQYRTNEMERKRMQRAIDRQKAERAALSRDTQQCAAVTIAIEAVASETMRAG